MTPLALALAPSLLGAQQQSAELSVPIRISVQPVVAIRSIVPMGVTTRSQTEVSATVVVNVESNLPYRLAVRPASTVAPNASRVVVRAADGTFHELRPGVSIAVVTRGIPGHQSHEISCRVEGATSDGCALVYELSAEYHDTLIRTTASGSAQFAAAR